MDPISPPAALPPGLWRAEGYGRILAVGSGHATLFDELAGRCLFHAEIPASQLAAVIGAPAAPVAPGAREAVTRLGASSYRWRRIDCLPAAPLAPCADPLLNAEIFLRTFAEHYAFFALRGVDWERAAGGLLARIAAPGAGADLFPLLAELLAPLNDGHVTLSDGERSFASGRIAAAAPDPDGLVPRGRVLQGALI
ncbi:MAG TPA: hypothetical protein VGE07_10280, partial [Herpetosiphonaceae bacterium]